MAAFCIVPCTLFFFQGGGCRAKSFVISGIPFAKKQNVTFQGTYHTWGKEKSSSRVPAGRGEDMLVPRRVIGCEQFFGC